MSETKYPAQKRYYERHREEILARRKKNYRPEKQREYQQHYREKDPETYAEKHRQAARDYHTRNREKILPKLRGRYQRYADRYKEKRREYYEKNKDRINALRREKRLTNPQPSRDQEKQRHRSLKQRIIEALGGRCSSCGYDKNTHVLNVHHKGEKLGKQDWKKKDGMSRLPYLELLCANCHQERHHPN